MSTSTAVQGLIIKETNVGEGDKILTILTPELGKIQAGANGARSYKSKLIAGCQLFCYSSFVLTKKKEWFRVCSAEPVETFYSLRTDLEKLALATYLCDLLCEVATDAHGADEMLRLALNTLYIITKRDDLALIKAAFELRLMAVSGFAPELGCCFECGSGDNLEYFSISDGGVYCAKCKVGGKISLGALRAMRYIVSEDIKKLFSFSAAEDVLAELSSVSENYALSNIGKSFRSLKYYLTIKKNMI